MTPLQLHINGWLTQPARWGVADCCLSSLDWVGQVRGLDLTEDLRLTYDDAASAQRATRFFTRPLMIAREYLERRAGCAPTTAPARGDVALFKLFNPSRGVPLPVGGICIAPGHFACRGEPGGAVPLLSLRPEALIGAWEVGYVE